MSVVYNSYPIEEIEVMEAKALRVDLAEARVEELTDEVEQHTLTINAYSENLTKAEAQRDAALNANVALRETLEAICDHKPDPIDEDIDHDSDNCADCKRMIGHPISQGRCNDWYHLYYRREDRRQRADQRQQYQMRGIARQALSDTPASDYMAVVRAAETYVANCCSKNYGPVRDAVKALDNLNQQDGDGK